VLFAFISTPPNFLWQQLLESWFPSQVPVKAAGEKEKKAATSKFSKTNTVKKFVADQLIGGPVNTVLFLAAMGYFRGLNGDVLLEYIREVSESGLPVGAGRGGTN
jgi:protein Mpv17